MNELNQIIIEGTVVSNVVDIPCTEAVKGQCSTIISNNGNNIKFISIGKLAEYVAKYASVERGLRVIGSLKSINNELVIAAEHVEFKPSFKAA